MSQFYVTEAENEYVIRGNSAVMKCKIPSFVADFVSVESWVSNAGNTLTLANTDYGKKSMKVTVFITFVPVVSFIWAWCYVICAQIF